MTDDTPIHEDRNRIGRCLILAAVVVIKRASNIQRTSYAAQKRGVREEKVTVKFWLAIQLTPSVLAGLRAR